MSDNGLELTILMPCLNEAETLAICIEKAQNFLTHNGIRGEVLIADNGSTDGSQDIARRYGARVVDIPSRGYGAAISGGIDAALGRYIIMGDADDSYDFSNLQPFVTKLRDGYDLVMGNRFKGGIAPGAMPKLHKYLGNPVLTFVGRLFFSSPCNDFHCGLRGFSRSSIQSLHLCTTGMELASEMVVKATLHGLKITEVPTTLSKDGRSRAPHLRSWRDGWRHLRFLLMYSPRWLFFYPGLCLFFAGLFGMVLLTPGAVRFRGVTFDVHTLLLSGTATIIGFQVLLFAFLAKQYCILYGFHRPTAGTEALLSFLTLERLLLAGLVLTGGGVAGTAWSAFSWGHHHFGNLDYEIMMRILVPSSVALVIGVQMMFYAFLAGIIALANPQKP